MKYRYLLMIVILISTYAISIFDYNSSIYLLILINIFILLFLLVNKYNFIFIFIWLFQWLIYFLALITHRYFFVLPGSGNDDIRFEKLSLNYYYHLAFGTEANIFQSSTFYSKILALFYYLGSPNELLPGLLNITIHSVALILLYKIVFLVFKEKKTAIVSTFLFTIYPLTLFNTVITLREIYVILSILLFTYSILKYHEHKKIRYIIVSLLSIAFGSMFHVGIVGLLLFLAAYFLLISRIRFNLKIIIFTTFTILFFTFITTTDNPKIKSIISEEENTVSQENLNSTSRADYLTPNESNGIINKFKQEIYFAFKPFPWEIRTFSDVIGFSNILFIWFSFYLGIRLYLKDRNENILIVLIIFAVMNFVFALGTYNYGSALRHRDKSSLLLIMFICHYYIYRGRRYK